MKIIVAPDSFKGSLTGIQAAEAMAAGIRDVDSTIRTVLMPVADGGEGTTLSLAGATGGTLYRVEVQDPLGRKIEAQYGILGDEETCVIEIAEASGLMRLAEDELNPLNATTFGTGELILHALNAGYRKFIIGLGGSATNDCGVGMLQALGMKLFDEDGMELLSGGGTLGSLREVDWTYFDKRISESNFLIACDVENPLVGPKGASFVFGLQKGATKEMMELLDMKLTNFANVVEKFTGISLHKKKGAGAAGGAGGAFQAFFPGEMKQGIGVVLDAISFEKHLQHADLVLTGEGKTDLQTLSGKAPFGVAKAAQRLGKPVILISGTVDEKSTADLSTVFTEIHGITDDTVSAADSMKNAYHYLRLQTKKTVGKYFSGKIH